VSIAHSWSKRQSTGKMLCWASRSVSATVFSHPMKHMTDNDGLGSTRNMNVCALGSDFMWSQHILLELLAVLHFIRPHMLLSTYSCRHLARRSVMFFFLSGLYLHSFGLFISYRWLSIFGLLGISSDIIYHDTPWHGEGVEGRKVESVGVMTDKELKLDDTEASRWNSKNTNCFFLISTNQLYVMKCCTTACVSWY